MPTITITCPTCTTKLEIDAKYRNEEVECGNCQQVFIAKAKGESSRSEDALDVEPLPKRKNRFRKEPTKDDYDDDDDYEDERPRRRSRYRRQGSQITRQSCKNINSASDNFACALSDGIGCSASRYNKPDSVSNFAQSGSIFCNMP